MSNSLVLYSDKLEDNESSSSQTQLAVEASTLNESETLFALRELPGIDDDLNFQKQKCTSSDDPYEDPVLAAATQKMRQLDCQLREKRKEERSIKRAGLELNKQLRQELTQLETQVPHSVSCLSQQRNADRFFGLNRPGRHSRNPKTHLKGAGVFQTEGEVDEEDIATSSTKDSSKKKSLETKSKPKFESVQKSQTLTSQAAVGLTIDRDNHLKKESKQKTDYIQRNKELAFTDNRVVPMTLEDQSRLDDLLDDLEKDQLDENTFNATATSEFDEVHQYLHQGEGYSLAREDRGELNNIDIQLRLLTNPVTSSSVLTEDVDSDPVANTANTSSQKHRLPR